MQQNGSPGFVIEVHPSLMRKEIFMDEVVSGLENAKRPNTAVVKDWLQKYGEYHNTAEGKNPVPAFTVNVRNRKFGHGVTRVETWALIYTCEVQDA